MVSKYDFLLLKAIIHNYPQKHTRKKKQEYKDCGSLGGFFKIIAKFWSSLQDVFYVKVSLKILQNSQENTCARVLFSTKLQASASGGYFWKNIVCSGDASFYFLIILFSFIRGRWKADGLNFGDGSIQVKYFCIINHHESLRSHLNESRQLVRSFMKKVPII